MGQQISERKVDRKDDNKNQKVALENATLFAEQTIFLID